MKRFTLILIAACVLFALSPAAFAASGNVVDNADVLSYSEISELSKEADRISEEYGLSVVLLTEDYLIGNTYSMADDHFYNGGYGDDGILFLLVVESRDWEIATYGEAVDLISDSKTEDLFQAARNDLADDEYYDGFAAYLEALDKQLSKAQTSRAAEPGVRWLISLVIGLVVALISLLIMRSKMNTVRAQYAATDYMLEGSYLLTRQKDLYLYSNTTRTRRAQNSSSGGGRSGGGSRGGSRGKF